MTQKQIRASLQHAEALKDVRCLEMRLSQDNLTRRTRRRVANQLPLARAWARRTGDTLTRELIA